jgi:hypothetical protein
LQHFFAEIGMFINYLAHFFAEIGTFINYLAHFFAEIGTFINYLAVYRQQRGLRPSEFLQQNRLAPAISKCEDWPPLARPPHITP